ncbi:MULTISPECIES: cytochrome P450 [unclassified Pseudonocardia]|uniref:cytochrome P450 family protein n=1 Tax=unclassified Pseudonocardia TaxID=2619320 RepID=UPI0001FFEB5A|nr:cytochrome P450 [Pseudonocardia sp. Ae707_Ps1]OLM17446.1 putative cytochrome P450 hydroxylase [Pseudonocardia sp. Ae707_Ps1]
MTTHTTDDHADPLAGTGCPVAQFRALRERGPVVDTAIVGTRTTVMVTGHDDVRAVLTDARFRSDAGTVEGAEDAAAAMFAFLGLPPDVDYLGRGLLTRDGADHSRLRKLVSRAFTVRRVNGLRPRVETITERLLDDVASAGADGSAVDLVTALARPLPIAVICELVGVPEDDRDRWDRLGRLLIDPDPERMPDAVRAVVAQIEELITARRAEPADDLLTALVEVHDDDGDRLTEREMVTMVFDIVTAGFETTAHLVAKAVQALLTRPDQLAALRAEPGLWPQAVHELVRICGPIPVTVPRYATEDVDVDGVTVPAGSTVMAALLSANTDPRVLDRLEELDVRRDPGRGEGHVGFGQGAHYCLGAALARQETEVVLRALFTRFPALRLAVDPGPEPSQLGFQRLAELPVRI